MVGLYIIEIIGDFLKSLALVYFFNKLMPPKSEKYDKLITVIMLILYTQVPAIAANNKVLNFKDEYIFIFISFYYALVFIYPFLFRKGRTSEKFFWSSFYISIIIVTSFVTYLVLAMIFDMTLKQILLEVNYKRSIAMLCDRLIQFLILNIYINKMNYIKYIKDNTLYIGGIILFVNHIVIFIIERDSVKNLEYINIHIVIAVLSICTVHVLSIYLLNIFSEEVKKNFTLKVNLERQIHDEEIIDMYTNITGWKHDFRNHINMILALLEVGTKEEAISYINEINDAISELDKSIYTDNIAINSILISKMKSMEDKNIEITLDLRINSQVKITNIDICTILGNLLDNSIEACDFVEGYKFINLTMISEDNRFVIKISNSTNGYINEVKGKFVTTKNNNMSGIGLIQVDNIVKKYDGYINRKHENNIFATYIMIQHEN